MTDLPPVVVDYIAVADDLGLKADTVYRWVKRGVVADLGRDSRRRSLVSFDDVARVAHERGLIE